MQPVLRLGDGFGDTTPNLMPYVERAQNAVGKAGHPVAVDGLFGRSTERAVERFQRDHGLVDDGIVGPATWRELVRYLSPRDPAPYSHIPGLESFHGDLAWIHEREGHNGKAYWPGGRSGVTLDPGFDLGRQDLKRTRQLYGELLTPRQYGRLRNVVGLMGRRASRALAGDPVLGSIRIRRSSAARIMPHVAAGYWRPITGRFRVLAEADTPGSVQTVLLSLAYNRGARNRHLGVLKRPVEGRDWLRVADLVGAMQQDHPLGGIRLRRRQEADLIRQELEVS